MRIPERAREAWWAMNSRAKDGVWISGDDGLTWRQAHPRQDDPTDFTPFRKQDVHWIMDYSPAVRRT